MCLKYGRLSVPFLAATVFLAGAVGQTPPKPPPLPAIDPAAARLNGTVAGLGGPGFAVAAHDGADMVAAACDHGVIHYWHKDVVQGVRTGRRTPNVLRGHKGAVLALAWGKGGMLASAGADGKVILWDLARAKPRRTIAAGTVIHGLALDPQGKLLAGGGEDAVVRLWDLGTGESTETATKPLQLKGHTDWVLCLAFSSDGKNLASGGYDGTVHLWDVGAKKKLRGFVARPPAAPNKPAEPETVSALAFSPDDKQLAVGNTEAEIHFFTAADGKLVRSLPGHASTVTALAFHPGGAVLVSASKDRTIRLWNAANGQPLKTLEGHTAWVEGVTFVARGTRLASVGADRTVRLWDLTTPPPAPKQKGISDQSSVISGQGLLITDH
jgi:WD40 repeat protein